MLPSEAITLSSIKTFKTEKEFSDVEDYICYVLSQFIVGANPEIKPSVAFQACETHIEDFEDIQAEEAYTAARAAYMEARCNTPVNPQSH